MSKALQEARQGLARAEAKLAANENADAEKAALKSLRQELQNVGTSVTQDFTATAPNGHR